MSKYEVLPQQLLYEGTITGDNLFSPEPLGEEQIIRVHDESYWKRLRKLALTPQEIRRTGFPLSAPVVDREVRIANGTVQAGRYALQYGVSMNIAGGTHHAFTNKGEGFCLLNDIALSAQDLLDHGLSEKILVVDLDVHQGNGTAQIFQSDPRVFTFSMHGANNYPLRKERSGLDVGLPDFTNDTFYLRTLDNHLEALLEQVQPDFIFYQAGVDVLETDKLGRLNISREGCRQRDKMVLIAAWRNKVPIVVTMGGGYSTDFRDIIEAHANTYRLVQSIWF